MSNIFVQPGLGEILRKQQEEALNRDILRAQAEQYRIKAQQARDPNRLSGSLPSSMVGFERYQQYTPDQRQAFENYLQTTKVNPYVAREGAFYNPQTGQFEASPTLGGALGTVTRDKIRTVAPAEAQRAGQIEQQKFAQQLAYKPLIEKDTRRAALEAERDIKKEKTDKIKSRVTNRLSDVAKLYQELRGLGAVVDPKKSTASNVSARIRASDVGQVVGGALGTKEQEVRQKIQQIRPTLMSDIRQATEMGARGLDSEKELDFYLQAVSDPKRSIGANMAALKVLDEAYGLGSTKVAASPKQIEKLEKEFEETLKLESLPSELDQKLLEQGFTPEQINEYKKLRKVE